MLEPTYHDFYWGFNGSTLVETQQILQLHVGIEYEEHLNQPLEESVAYNFTFLEGGAAATVGMPRFNQGVIKCEMP